METRGCAIAMKEAKFDLNELFFSITDHASTILSGNEVFVRISGYSKAELIGQFHNIIRHPDMPRAVFKTFWDLLKEDKPVVAYVKNRTKEGGFYWVLAAVFPMNGQYVSIRIKPNSAIFSVVRELYFKLLMAESKGGMEASEPLLKTLLNDLGFDNYEHFMSSALLAELVERKKSMGSFDSASEVSHEADSALNHQLSSLLSNSQVLMKRYDLWFEKIDLFTQVKSMFEEKGILLRHLARDIVFLSLNASVASYKVATGGETFGVLASDIRINAKENDTLIEHIHELAQSLSNTLNEMIFTVSVIRIQIEMVHYFLQETLSNSGSVSTLELGENLEILIGLVSYYSDKLNTLQRSMEHAIKESLKNLEQLEQQVMYLGYIQVYGIIEAAGNNDETIGFGGIFSQLKDLIRRTSDEIAIMQKMGASFYNENRNLIDAANRINSFIDEMKPQTSEIKVMG